MNDLNLNFRKTRSGHNCLNCAYYSIGFCLVDRRSVDVDDLCDGWTSYKSPNKIFYNNQSKTWEVFVTDGKIPDVIASTYEEAITSEIVARLELSTTRQPKIIISGEPLSVSEWDRLADITELDLEQSQDFWKETVPDPYRKILDARANVFYPE